MAHILCQPMLMSIATTPASRIDIRDVKSTDAGAIAAIYAAHVATGTASFDTVALSVEETAAKISSISGKGWPFLVAVRDDDVVGYAYANQFRDRAAYSFTCENSIYIRSDQVGRGVGSILLSALISRAEAFGFRQMMAVIGGGEPASVALHSKLGFQHAGQMRSVGRKFGRWLDTVYMQLPMGAGDSQPPGHEPA
jgi:L-amino acid N-acyltransferase YncA